MQKQYFGKYRGIVVQNDDPLKGGRVKVFVPAVNIALYEQWNSNAVQPPPDDATNPMFSFIGGNIASDLMPVLLRLKDKLPWCEVSQPVVGSSASGFYNAPRERAKISHASEEMSGIREKALSPEVYVAQQENSLLGIMQDDPDSAGAPISEMFRKHPVSDGFTQSGTPTCNNQHHNPFAALYRPSAYANKPMGSFSIPNVGAMVWVFFEQGDPQYPVVDGVIMSQQDIKAIWAAEDSGVPDYPADYENKQKDGAQTEYGDTFRGKWVVAQRGGSIELVSTSERERLRFTHHNGSMLDFNKLCTSRLATENDQLLVMRDQFRTVYGCKSVFVGGDHDVVVYGDSYHKTGDIRNWKPHSDAIRDLLRPLHNDKRLFELKRTPFTDEEDHSPSQTRDGEFAPCPVCAQGVEFVQIRTGRADLLVDCTPPDETAEPDASGSPGEAEMVTVAEQQPTGDQVEGAPTSDEFGNVTYAASDSGGTMITETLPYDPSAAAAQVSPDGQWDAGIAAAALQSPADATGGAAATSDEFGNPLTGGDGAENTTTNCKLQCGQAATGSHGAFARVLDRGKEVIDGYSGSEGKMYVEPCWCCGGSGLSPSSQDGAWKADTIKAQIVKKIEDLTAPLNEHERKMGQVYQQSGGNTFDFTAKHRQVLVGTTFNDFESYRRDEIGKLVPYGYKVEAGGVYPQYAPSPLVEAVHVDTFPGGDYDITACHRFKVNAGSGGVRLKTTGGFDIFGTILKIAGEQLLVSTRSEVVFDAGSRFDVEADIITLRPRKIGSPNATTQQVAVVGNLNVSKNVVVRGGLHSEGELSFHHLTAPLEWHQTNVEPKITSASLLAGKTIGAVTVSAGSSQVSAVGSTTEQEVVLSGTITINDEVVPFSLVTTIPSLTVSTQSDSPTLSGEVVSVCAPDAIEVDPHVHWVMGPPMTLMQTHDQVRQTGARLNAAIVVPAHPINSVTNADAEALVQGATIGHASPGVPSRWLPHQGPGGLDQFLAPDPELPGSGDGTVQTDTDKANERQKDFDSKVAQFKKQAKAAVGDKG